MSLMEIAKAKTFKLVSLLKPQSLVIRGLIVDGMTHFENIIYTHVTNHSNHILFQLKFVLYTFA